MKRPAPTRGGQASLVLCILKQQLVSAHLANWRRFGGGLMLISQVKPISVHCMTIGAICAAAI